MKKVYFIFFSTIWSLLLLFGSFALYSHADIPPKESKDMALPDQLHHYLAESFPQKEQLKELQTELNGFYHFSGFSKEEEVQLLLPIQNDAADHGSAVPTESGTEPTSQTATEAMTEEVTESTEAIQTEPTTEATEEPKVEALGQMLLVDDRALELPVADYEVIRDYAQTVSAIAQQLEGVKLYSILVPNASGLYAPEAYQSGNDSQKNMIDYAYYNMDDSVTTVDVFSVLQEHREEYLYFRTDHHWTHLGSYYAYAAFCKEAGYVAQPLNKFETGVYDSFLGSMYGFLSGYPQREILRENPDVLEYYIPFRSNQAYYYDNAEMGYAGSIQTIYPVSESMSNKYLCFLGGDHPITVIETDIEDGPVCLLIKESYGNAFSTWLTSHYSKIICIDPREFNRNGKPSLDLVSFAARMEIDDCIILNYPLMINSEAYTAWLGRMVP